MAETLANQLANVQEAIRRIELGAQRVRLHNGAEYTHADLATLYERERAIKADLNTEQSGGVSGGALYKPVAFGGGSWGGV